MPQTVRSGPGRNHGGVGWTLPGGDSAMARTEGAAAGGEGDIGPAGWGRHANDGRRTAKRNDGMRDPASAVIEAERDFDPFTGAGRDANGIESSIHDGGLEGGRLSRRVSYVRGDDGGGERSRRQRGEAQLGRGAAWRPGGAEGNASDTTNEGSDNSVAPSSAGLVDESTQAGAKSATNRLSPAEPKRAGRDAACAESRDTRASCSIRTRRSTAVDVSAAA